jgi:hypothetical protein
MPDPDDVWRGGQVKALEATTIVARMGSHSSHAVEVGLRRLRELYPDVDFTWEGGGLHLVTWGAPRLPKAIKYKALTIRERLPDGRLVLRKNVTGVDLGTVEPEPREEIKIDLRPKVWHWLTVRWF